MLLLLLLVAASSVFADVDYNVHNFVRVCSPCEPGPQCTHDPYICRTSTTPVILNAVSQGTCGRCSSGPKCTQDFDICPTPVTVTSTQTLTVVSTQILPQIPVIAGSRQRRFRTHQIVADIPNDATGVRIAGPDNCVSCHSGPLCTRNVSDEGCNE